MVIDDQNPRPELIFGLVGPIGVDMDIVTRALTNELRNVDYNPQIIHVTTLLRAINPDVDIDEDNYANKYHSLIDLSDNFRNRCNDNSALAGLAITEIRRIRESLTLEDKKNLEVSAEQIIPSNSTAYIIRQFKRPEEIKLLRQTYGRKFIQVSVYSSRNERIESITKKIQRNNKRSMERVECELEATNLVQKDFDEKDKNF